MATIQHGHPSYSYNYPVLWSDWSDPLYMYESPSFSSTKLIQIARYQLVHYVSGYMDSGGYRWFFCRVWRSGRERDSLWEVGWVPAVRLSDGRQVLKALGRYESSGRRLVMIYPTNPCLCVYGCQSLDDPCNLQAWDVFSSCYNYGDVDWDPYVNYCCAWIENKDINRKIVPYPGQESTYKPWVVSGANNWWLCGGWMQGVAVRRCREDLYFLVSGIDRPEPGGGAWWWRRIN